MLGMLLQVGMSGVCYPDNLIGDIPNLYYYAANNPSEATIAKRRSYANTISYLTPPAENAGLYKGLKELKELISSYQVRCAALFFTYFYRIVMCCGAKCLRV